MTDREKLISIIEDCRTYVAHKEELVECLIANGVTITPEIPGPEIADPNIMELCFHNGERHMKEKVIDMLMDHKTQVGLGCYEHVVEIIKMVERL